MKSTEDRIAATNDSPEKFKVYVCPSLNCPNWWPLSHGSGKCDDYESHPLGDYPDMRPLTLIAEKDTK